MPKRIRRIRSSRGVMLPRTRLTASRRSDWIAASRGWTASSSSIRSPRWLSSSPIGVSRLIGSRGNLHRLAHLVERHAEAFRKLLQGRLASELLPHLPGQPPQSGAHLDHVHRNADRRRRVGDRAGDRLADPPGRIGRELEAPAVVELVHALHQPDIALLDQVQELEAPVPVPLGDRDHASRLQPRRLASTIFFLGLARLALRPQDCTGDPLELDRLQAGVPGQSQDVLARALVRLSTRVSRGSRASFARQPRDASPWRGSSKADIRRAAVPTRDSQAASSSRPSWCVRNASRERRRNRRPGAKARLPGTGTSCTSIPPMAGSHQLHHDVCVDA